MHQYEWVRYMLKSWDHLKHVGICQLCSTTIQSVFTRTCVYQLALATTHTCCPICWLTTVVCSLSDLVCRSPGVEVLLLQQACLPRLFARHESCIWLLWNSPVEEARMKWWACVVVVLALSQFSMNAYHSAEFLEIPQHQISHSGPIHAAWAHFFHSPPLVATVFLGFWQNLLWILSLHIILNLTYMIFSIFCTERFIKS